MRPLIRHALIVWNTFLRDTSNPMSPYLPAIVRRLNELEKEK